MIFEMFSYNFIVRAFIVGTLVSLCAALLGVTLVLKRYSMIGDGLSHVGFGALAVAAALNLAPLEVAVPVIIIAAFLLLRLSENSKINGDAAIAIISSTALAIGVVFVSVSGVNTDLNSYLFGSILATTTADAIMCGILALVVIVIFILFYNKIFAVTFDETFSRATGLKTGVYNTVIALLTALTIVIGMRIMGTLLISALIIFPALSSMRVCKKFKSVILCSGVLEGGVRFSGSEWVGIGWMLLASFVYLAYWRGHEDRKMLTRIYGITFPKKKMLDEYLVLLEEAKKRDHRKIGKEMQLFMFSETVGKGLPMWLPKGTALRLRLQEFLLRIQTRYDYQEVITPPIGNKLLYVTSGHYAKYGKDAFQPIHTPEEGEEYFLKPMNCPHHCEIYKNFPRSYKDLPLRIAEFGTVCRYEQSGELHGLTRVRSFTQDDAHIFCRPDQVKDEFLRVMDIISIVFRSMNFQNFEAQISLRDKVNREKYIGSDDNWEKAEQAIIEACEEKGLPAKIEYGEAAFYGPKLDFMVKDAIGRRWQLGTIQVDYNLPERFELEYMGSDNQKHRPVMIHRAPFGSMERFVAVLIEHTAGKFPLWLTPDQVAILPISEKFNEYAEQVKMYLKMHEIRAIVDDRNEKIGRKIRDNEMKRIPYMLIVGEKEAENGENIN